MNVGDVVGPYRIVSRLSEGGMATLLLGRRVDDPHAEPVAIKAIHEHLSQDWQFVRMFVDEALICVRLRHPNVVRVDELGEHGHLYYLVMEYVRGCSLAQLLRTIGRQGRRLRPEIAVWIAREVAAGLHAAHEMTGEGGVLLGVVHRDVSPQNVLLSVDGDVKLLDFGIAKARGRAERTEAGVIKGKVRYMAPEQAAGEPIDRRTDVYALGVVLWEMLTMRRYLEGKSEVELIRRVRSPMPVAASVHVPALDPRIDHAVLRALEPLAERRPPTAQAWLELLDAAVEVPVGREHVAEVLRLFMVDEITESSRVLPPDVGARLVAEVRGAKNLPGEANGAATDDASRVRTLTSRAPPAPFDELGASAQDSPRIDPPRATSGASFDAAAPPTRGTPPLSLASAKAAHRERARAPRLAWIARVLLVMIVAFGVGAAVAALVVLSQR